MSGNDSILIDGIIDERIEQNLPSKKRGEAFELFAAEQITKDYNISLAEVMLCSMDGRDDGGIDYCFIFVNGHLLTSTALFFWPRTNAEIEVFIITSKHHDTYKQAPLDNMVASVDELFNFRLSSKELKGSYSKKIQDFRERLKFAYKKTAQNLTNIYVNYYYVSRGDSSQVGGSIQARADQIVEMTKQCFSNCISSFKFFGSSELISLNRKKKTFVLELPFNECFSSGERYVLLSKIQDYYKFMIDENGKLRRYLFDANVRDYMGLNRVNDDIRVTLENGESPDFWWLNNGITILALGARVVGDMIHVEDIQIVNGLQTSESIYNFFKSGGQDVNGRSVLIKIIVTNDEAIRDQIIQATNNQTPVEIASLHASDKIQKNIEDILCRYDYFYERRTNFYKNQKKDSTRIVLPLYLASGYLGLVLKQPHMASKLKNKFVRNEKQYEQIFSDKCNLKIWPQLVAVLKRTDLKLNSFRSSSHSSSENFLKRWRHIVSLLVLALKKGDFNYSTEWLLELNVAELTDDLYVKVWDLVCVYDYDPYAGKRKTSKALFDLLVSKAEKDLGIANSISILKRKSTFVEEKSRSIFSRDFVEAVNNLLPDQPWKPGVHLDICRQLKCATSDVNNAILVLIRDGKRLRQKNGVVYDEEGNVKMIDAERVDKETFLLKK